MTAPTYFAGAAASELARRYTRGDTLKVIAKDAGCSQTTAARALRRLGVPLRRRGYVASPLTARLWERVARGASDACWPYTAGLSNSGYGQFHIKKRPVGAHRVAFFLTHGHWPNIARHTCDNRPCCNPNHIIDGTIADNQRDMAERGRAARGSRNPRALLREDDVAEIRTLVGLCRVADVARAYGVKPYVISMIKHGRTWRHA